MDGLREMYQSYEQSLAQLMVGRERLAGEYGRVTKRFLVLEQEIEELEEAMMMLRKHL